MVTLRLVTQMLGLGHATAPALERTPEPRCPAPRFTAALPVRALERAGAEALGAGARPVHRARARHRGRAALSGSASALRVRRAGALE